MLKFLSIFCLFALISIGSISTKQTLSELIYGNQLPDSDFYERITLSQIKSPKKEQNTQQQYSKLQLDNQKLDQDLLLIVKQEEQEKLNKIKKAQRKLKPQKSQEIIDGEPTKTPVPEEDLVLQADQQISNITDNSTDSNSNSSGLISTIFHSVTNYLFENGTGAFFQLKQFNQNSNDTIEEEEQQ